MTPQHVEDARTASLNRQPNMDKPRLLPYQGKWYAWNRWAVWSGRNAATAQRRLVQDTGHYYQATP